MLLQEAMIIRKIYTLQAKSRISTYVLHVIIVMFATR